MFANRLFKDGISKASELSKSEQVVWNAKRRGRLCKAGVNLPRSPAAPVQPEALAGVASDGKTQNLSSSSGECDNPRVRIDHGGKGQRAGASAAESN
jgi:hypothetical protein